MLRYIIFFLLVLKLIFPLQIKAEINISGALKNDSVFTILNKDTVFNNILESKLVLSKKTEYWKFYSDFRCSVYQGESIKELGEELNMPLAEEIIKPELLRALIAYYTDYGDISLGKTYVNLGVSSIFNPFELDTQLNPSDLTATKQGILALVVDSNFGDLSGCKLYLSPEAKYSDIAIGLDFYTHIESSDIGVVLNHKDKNDNIAGIYFKGDMGLGVQGAYAYHFSDALEKQFFEANFGFDYSFLQGKLLINLLGYCNSYTSYKQSITLLTKESNIYSNIPSFLDEYYLYFNLNYVLDEFFNTRLDTFGNLRDHSVLLILTNTWILANGLSAALQVSMAEGETGSEFSSGNLGGKYNFLVRVEAKL